MRSPTSRFVSLRNDQTQASAEIERAVRGGAGATIYALFGTSRQISTGPSSSLAAVAVACKPTDFDDLDPWSISTGRSRLQARSPCWSCPFGARLATEALERGVERGKEVAGVEGPDQLIALEFRVDRVLEFGEDE